MVKGHLILVICGRSVASILYLFSSGWKFIILFLVL